MSGTRRVVAAWFRSGDLLDRTFAAGVLAKGLNGVLELAGGILLLLVTPTTINQVVAAATQGELSEDPRDLIDTHLLRAAHGLTGSTVLFGATYLLAHGLVKIVLVVALLQNRRWAYPWMIAFLALFIAYQLYRIALTPTPGLIALTLLDLTIAWLTYREYPQTTHAESRTPSVDDYPLSDNRRPIRCETCPAAAGSPPPGAGRPAPASTSSLRRARGMQHGRQALINGSDNKRSACGPARSV